VAGAVIVAAVAKWKALVPARDGQPQPLAVTDELDRHLSADRLFGIRCAVMIPVAVLLVTDVSMKSVAPPMPHPAVGASGHVDRSLYVWRRCPSGWMSRPSSWACQLPVNGAIPGTSAAVDGAKTIAAVAKPASATILMHVAALMPVLSGRLRTIGDLEWAKQRTPWFDTVAKAGDVHQDQPWGRSRPSRRRREARTPVHRNRLR
jgi:hypothetical protein